MAHDCPNEGRLSTMEANIQTLQRDNDQAETWRTRMEDKIDKILWFLLGQSVTLILTVLAGVMIYAITKG